MTDSTGGNPPFPGFPGFPPAEMLDKMWDMMRMTPFGAAFPGMQPGTAQGFASPLTAMSEMMSPLMNVEELDKRITDMRAVEQWLKLNLNMLQSAIQALEVQRATLATLRAFGAFAQDAMAQPAEGASQAGARASGASPWSAAASGAGASAEGAKGATASADAQQPQASAEASAGEGGPAFDPSAWWNLLQSQFNQLAAFAMTQPGAGANADGEAAASAGAAKKKTGAAARGAKSAAGGASTASAKPAAKRAPARKNGATPAAGPEGGAGRGEK
ncbi:PhaM family polyhydroxyalkanoate granule multifunctional regulatory protein [Trinickia sp. Y13]|uniref:PhaM family polyhydroxyalkanoate granule multifunctional regulatory protein n=1 Tax=Trinickia sp. Y13 TaxID=2917807 RepID=UPI0024058A2B|nr:PhaM family polyhydroxyalkanoate granule multifunctional regulatory protein [Trinickia sp. Y13]MDG0023577.1 transcriptional regulator [Trinickia sp. Y13]